MLNINIVYHSINHSLVGVCAKGLIEVGKNLVNIITNEIALEILLNLYLAHNYNNTYFTFFVVGYLCADQVKIISDKVNLFRTAEKLTFKEKFLICTVGVIAIFMSNSISFHIIASYCSIKKGADLYDFFLKHQLPVTQASQPTTQPILLEKVDSN